MATLATKNENLLYLDEITLQNVLNRQYTLRLFIEDEERELQTRDNRTWTPVQSLGVSPTSNIRTDVQMRSGHLFWAKHRERSEVIDLQLVFNGYWDSTKHEFTLPKVVVVGKHRWSLELRFSVNTAAEFRRSSLHTLEGLLEEYSPFRSGSIESAVDKAIKHGAVFAELNPLAKAFFGIAKVTFELLKEQNKYDQVPSALLSRLQGILVFADKVADEIVFDETVILEKVIPRMFEVMQRVAKISCDCVRHVLGPAYLERIEEMEGELTRVVADFGRAVDAEALHRTKRTEQDFLLARLRPVETGYRMDLRCMDGTRQFLLRQIIAWVSNKSEQRDGSNTYWIYGLPGIGKTSLAHSICADLHKGRHLAGAFFCRRSDRNLSEPRNIVPTLIYKLALLYPPFRSIVANRLRIDPNLIPESMSDVLLVFIRSLPRQPQHPLVFVIDALDQCGDSRTRSGILRVLSDAAAQAPWLKVIITSRPEVDIQHFFDAATSSHLRYDLAADEEATADLRTFARSQFDLVASKWYPPTPWPEESLFDRVISQANGIFLFVKTLVLALEQCEDPGVALKAALQDSAGTGLGPLYGLYFSILQTRIVHSHAEFRQMIGVLLASTPYSLLCEETIAELAGVKLDLVKKWVDDLSSLLYRDEGAGGGIRVRHPSIFDFFLSDQCDYQVNHRDANVQLGIACLMTMVTQLCFNICKLEDSRLANANVDGLPSRIKEYISDPLQYSSLHWSSHLCFSPHNGNRRVLGSLKEFFEGLYPLLWIEVLSIMGMVPIGAPSLRRVVSWARGADSTLRERIQDVCRFIITFHTPVSISAPHTYISTRPFLPSQSPLSTIFSTRFTKAIRMQRGKLLSWPAPPPKWIGHTDAVNCISYSPDGYRIVSGSNDNTIRIWDAETGVVVGEPLIGHTGCVRSIGYSPNGRRIVSGSDDKRVRIWDAETGEAVGEPLEGHNHYVLSVAYSPDGRYIISGSRDKTIRIWDAETGAATGRRLEGHTWSVYSVAYSPNGQHVVSGSGDKTIRIWDAETGAAVGEPLVGHTQYVWSIVYSPDGQRIISGSNDGTIRIWDAETGATVGKPLKGDSRYVLAVAYSPDGRRIISGSADGIIQIWDAETGAAVRKPLEGHTGSVLSISYSPDGHYIISGSRDKTIRVWDAETGAAMGKPVESTPIRSIAYSPDARHITSGSGDGTVRIWDARTGAAVGGPLEGHTGVVYSITYSPDGQHIISGSNDETIRIWDAETGAAVGKPLEGHTGVVYSIAYSPDEQHIISGSEDETIRIWDAETGAAVGKPLEGHTGAVCSIAYSPDGQHIISGSDDKTIRIRHARTGAAVGKPLEGHTGDVLSIAYSPDGRHIISGSGDGAIRIWDTETGSAVGRPLEGHNGIVSSVASSPNGQHIISGSGDTTIRIWDAKTGVGVGQPLRGHSDYVWSIASSPDGQHIASGSEDGTIRVWDSFPHGSFQLSSSCSPMHSDFYARPGPGGWVRDSEGGLLYWVPPDCRTGLHSPALLTIPPTSHLRSVSLDFEDFAFGTSWTQIFNSTRP